MLRDVFYYGSKPNAHPRERLAENLADAREKSTTEHFWIINEFCDYRNFDWDFDFEFLPDEDVWAGNHNNAWPSQHQKDSGTWLCPKEYSEFIIYRGDVDPVIRKNEKQSDNWVELDLIDHTRFDFSWHPDPTDPPYIYKWGCKFFPAQFKHVLEYRVPGATQEKYMDTVVELLPEWDRWHVPNDIDRNHFDFSWRPDPLDPPLVYEFSTQWQRNGGPIYTVPGATDRKYLNDQKAIRLPSNENWTIPDNIDISGFDFSWHPDNTSPPYVYVFPTQWALSGGPVYTVEGATELKYVEEQSAIALPNRENWEYDETLIDIDSFDFSWHPYAEDDPYIYQFGTQWQKTGGPRYIVKGASQVKYVDTRILKATRLPNMNNWDIPESLIIDTEKFDFSWHPDDLAPPYIYQFDTQWALRGGPRYVVPGATEVSYVEDVIAVAGPCMDNWEYDEKLLDVSNFDFSWHPYVDEDQPYIYQFGTQWQKTGGPRYVVPGALQVKYVDTRILKATRLPNKDNWDIPDYIDSSRFDFSWHPDDTNPPYTYVFATQWAFSGGPVYKVPGATEIKYVDDQIAVALPNKQNWEYDPTLIDEDSIDFSWHPYVEDQPYIYQFGTQWQKTGGPRYVVPGASQVKYVDTRILKATRLPNKDNWDIPANLVIDTEKFDLSWHPDDTVKPYIYQFDTQWALRGGPRYVVPGATEVSYVEDIIAYTGPCMDNWEYDEKSLDVSNFDFSWHPYVDEDQPYIYQFGTQWQKTGGPRYVVPGATQIKYVDTRILKATRLPNMDNWEIPKSLVIDTEKFDFSWHPDDLAPPYIYQFDTQWALYGGPRYVVPGATEINYIEDVVAYAGPCMDNWEVPDDIAVEEFDFSWHPYVDEDQPYIYQFGTQWQKTGGPRYLVPGATQVKYIDTRILKARKLPNPKNFKVLGSVKIKDFDFSWHPDDTSPPYIYQFGNQWYPAEEMPTIEYTVEGATETQFISTINATLSFDMTNWDIPAGVNVAKFDFSWIPHPAAPPYIYQFGTLQDPTDGPIYNTPNTNGEVVKLPRIEIEEDAAETEKSEIVVSKYYIETTLDDLVKQHETELFWALNPDIDYGTFDFTWRPSIEQAQYVHAFGSRDNIDTQTYFINGPQWAKGNRDINYVEDVKIDIKVNIDMFYVDRGNSESSSRFEALKAKYGTRIQKTRYLNSWVDTIKRCTNRATTSLIWVLNSELDYNDFNFDYYPNPWQMKMVHVFGTQHSHWGTTFMVNRETFAEDTKWINIIEHLSNLNFVKDRRAKATSCLYDVLLINHGNKECHLVESTIKSQVTSTRTVTVVDYDDSYLNTIRNYVKKLPDKKEHYLWICSSVCNYTNFDFSYICDPYSKENLHVFPSGSQKFGDTFLIDVNKTKEIIDDLDRLEEYEKVNYNGSVKTERLPEPIIVTSDDTHVNSVKNVTGFPYATIITKDNADIDSPVIEPMNLWASDTKNIIITSTGATRIVVPLVAKDIVKQELYDYPHIKRTPKLIKSKPLDIIFLSNGEKAADENWEHLLDITNGLANRVVRVDGVNGRAAAYHAAAEASETPWMFTVFAKLKVSYKFDWNWQPDRMQIPKHYIFHAKNPVNGLTYGHQAMIAYNKKLTLANEGHGLDFTLDDAHEVVPLLSGVANYNTDPFSTWRTAFREVIKLRDDNSETARERLDAWLNKAEGDFAEYSIKGALDADEYYDEVDGDFNKLKLSYEWVWLQDRFNKS